MTQDQTVTGIADRLLAEHGISGIRCLRDEVLVLGVRQSFSNLAVPVGEDGPMDHPTMGIALLCGPDCVQENRLDKSVYPGLLCYFKKFSGNEVQVGSRRFFTVKVGDVKMVEEITTERADQLARNSY